MREFNPYGQYRPESTADPASGGGGSLVAGSQYGIVDGADVTKILPGALNECSQNGWELVLPQGTFYTSEPIVINAKSVMVRGVPGKTVIKPTKDNFNAFEFGPGASGSGLDASGHFKDIIIEGPTKAPTTKSVGVKLNGLRFFTFSGITVRNMDVGYDLVNNCYGTQFFKCKTEFNATNVGIRLRGQQPDGSWGSGSDLTFINCWFHGKLAGAWIEKDGGGYHFVRGQLTAGEGLTADTDIAGALVLGANYEDPTNTALYGDSGNVSLYGVDVEGFKRCYAIRSFGRTTLQLIGNSFLATATSNVAMGLYKGTNQENGSVTWIGNTIKGTYSQDLASIAGQGSAFGWNEQVPVIQATVKGTNYTPGTTIASQSNLALGTTLGRSGGRAYIEVDRMRIQQDANGNPKIEVSLDHGATFPHVVATVKYDTKAPTTTPEFAGQEFLDTQNKVWYKATGTTSAADWQKQGDATISASQISDASQVGRSILTAADAAAVRTAIDLMLMQNSEAQAGTSLVQRSISASALAAGAKAAIKNKTEIAALTALAADADLPTTVAKVNAIIAALKA